MMRALSISLAAALALGTLAGCATSTRSDHISRAETGRMSTVLDAVVLSVRSVSVENAPSGAGVAAGATVGAIAGSSVGGRRDSAAAGVLGAVAGAVVGQAIERSQNREEAQEIIVQLRNGERRAIVQGKSNEVLRPGDSVIIVTTGNRVRVTLAPYPSVPPQSSPMPLPAPSQAPGTTPAAPAAPAMPIPVVPALPQPPRS
jgi:outer membrane lipoprotein SlyB